MDSVSKKRQYNLDLLKAVAIICMLFTHPVLIFAVYRNGWDSGFLTFLGDVVFGDYIAAAHAFMLAMGVGMVYSRKNDPTSMITRGVKIFAAGYILNFCRHGVYFLIMNMVHHEFRPETVAALFSPDIFQFAGLAYIVTGIFVKLRLKERHILMVGIFLSAIAPFIPDAYTGNIVLDFITGNFVYVSPQTSTFVFADWYIFVAVGIFLGSLLRSSDDPDGFYRKMLWSGIIAGAYIVATFINGPFWLSPDQDYYRVGIVDAAGLLSMDFFVLAVFYFVLKKTGAERFSVFIEMSRNITVIYVIHWCILGLTDFVCGDIFGLVFSYPVIYAIGAVLLVVSFYLARLWRSYRNGHSVKIPAD